MKALISPTQPVETGLRIADVHPEGFDVAAPLFWVDCPDNVIADWWYYDNGEFKETPVPEELPMQAQPVSQGSQTL